MDWRLGLDVGTNSLGWAVLRLDESEKPVELIDSGVRVYSDGRDKKDKQSLATSRREPRGARRNRDRYLKRRAEFMTKLIKYELMPSDEAARKLLEKEEDPWMLRVRGLDEKLSLHKLGRALFHLQQRRGFKSNRKTDKGDEDKGKIDNAADRVTESMKAEGARTLGELLARPRVDDPKVAATTNVRARLHGTGAKAFYEFYPMRNMIAHEFDTLWAKQKEFHGEALTESARADLRNTLLFQRQLKPQPVGKCSLDPSEERAPRALPTVQRRRIYEEVNHLRLRLPGKAERKLTLEERDKIANKLLNVKEFKFESIRNLIKQPDARFNTESIKRKHLDGDKTAAVLANKNRWGTAWRDLQAHEQESIVERLIEEENKDTLVAWLISEYGLTKERAEAVTSAQLPDGHGRLGKNANRKILAELEQAVVTYDQAVAAAGYNSHSKLDFDGEVFDRLPYYGVVLERHIAFGSGEPHHKQEKRLGKVPNPTVHVALNQIRKLVNALMKRYGPPKQIVVELARDLPLSAKGKSDLEKQQAENQKANEKRAEELTALGQRNSYENRLRLRLWEELNLDDPLNRCCPYTGKQISIERLFSDEIEIDHILPRAKTLDDSFANKTLCFREANRVKENRPPYEAFSGSPSSYDWEKIAERSANLPPNKSWRFGPDAMVRYENEEQDFLARQLGDTRHISRLAKTYLLRASADVWVSPGRLTSDLRQAWGLNLILSGHNKEEAANPKKNRNDHRQHAIDAVVIALTDRRLLQIVATEMRKAEEKFAQNWLACVPDPWPGFRNNVRESIDRIIVSHKQDHGLQGELHEGTNYGLVKDPITGESRLASRKALVSLRESEIDKIGDLGIRAELQKRVDELKDQSLNSKEREKVIASLLENFSSETGVRRVRVHKVQADYEIIRHNGHEKAVIPGENFCVDIVETPDGKWRGVGVTRFDANRQNRLDVESPLWKQRHPDAKYIMRVHKGDLLKLKKDGREETLVVRRLDAMNGRFKLAAHYEAGNLDQRHNADNDEDDFRWLMASYNTLHKAGARLVHIDPAGKVHDPGLPK